MSKYVEHFYQLPIYVKEYLKSLTPNFGYNGFGELVYYRTYSRNKNGVQEQWADTVIRVIEGIFSIRKDWYLKNHIYWDQAYWDTFAAAMAESMFRMEWLPPGRGLWAMGTDLIYERGSMALYNCLYTNIGDNWIEDLCWLMDSLMYGCGVGFGPKVQKLELSWPEFEYQFVIPDSREGWVDSVRRLLLAYYDTESGRPVFDYSIIRPEGALIKTFGGTASGPQPLKDLHHQIEEACERKIEDPTYHITHFLTDLANQIGVCVVTGNVRRSAEIGLAPFDDPVFLDLKNYELYPERASWGWMSNNSVLLKDDQDFERMQEIADRVIANGEPGYVNVRNLRKGRIGDTYHKLKADKAEGINPCGEIPLEDKESCNIAETFPTRCVDFSTWLNACRYATFYCSTVSLLPTHSPETNRVVVRNRRIGVSIVDFTGWKYQYGVSKITKYLREGYNTVREFNRKLAEEAGVPESIRVTTIKPGGTVPKLAGRTSGAGYQNFKYAIRRIRVQENTPFEKLLIDAGIPHEPDFYSRQTTCFEYPVNADVMEVAEDITLWEQAVNLVLLQREWADNAVSNTLNFKPKWVLYKIVPYMSDINFEYIENSIRYVIKNNQMLIYKYNPKHEEHQIEAVLAAIAPHTKSVSLMPHSDKGVYCQMPEEGISLEECIHRLEQIKSIDWSKYKADSVGEKYCTSEKCEIGV